MISFSILRYVYAKKTKKITVIFCNGKMLQPLLSYTKSYYYYDECNICAYLHSTHLLATDLRSDFWLGYLNYKYHNTIDTFPQGNTNYLLTILRSAGENNRIPFSVRTQPSLPWL